MKIKMLKHNFPYLAGQIVDQKTEIAVRWVEKGIASYVKVPKIENQVKEETFITPIEREEDSTGVNLESPEDSDELNWNEDSDKETLLLVAKQKGIEVEDSMSRKKLLKLIMQNDDVE